MRAPIRRPVRHKTLLTLFRAFRSSLRPHARSGGDAARQDGRSAWTHGALIAAMAAAAGSPAFAGPPAGRLVLHTNQERIVKHTNQDMQGLRTLPADPVPWLGRIGVAQTVVTSPGSVTGLPAAVPWFDVRAFDVPALGLPALPDPLAHGNSPSAGGIVGSIPAAASLPLLGMALLVRTGRTRRRLDRSCTAGCVK